MTKDELIIRLQERIKVYENVRGSNANLGDLCFILEDLIQIIKSDKELGFKNGNTQG